MSTILCRLSYGTLSFRPESIAVPSEVTFEVAGLPDGQQCDLVIADPRTLTQLVSAQITAAGKCTINTNTSAFRALFADDRATGRQVLVQIGSPANLLASGLVVARWNILASDDTPPAPEPDTRYLTDADYRALVSAQEVHSITVYADLEVLQARLAEQGQTLNQKADTATVTALTQRIDDLAKSPEIDAVILGRIQAFNPATATVDQLWQQVSDLSSALSVLLS